MLSNGYSSVEDPELWSEIVHSLQGTCKDLDNVLLGWFDLQYDEMPLEFFSYLDGELLLCDCCGWWVDSSEESETVGFCTDCALE